MFSNSGTSNLSRYRIIYMVFFLAAVVLYVFSDNITKYGTNVESSLFSSSKYAHPAVRNATSMATSIVDETSTIRTSTDYDKLLDYNSSIHHDTSTKYNISTSHSMLATTPRAAINCSIVVCSKGNLGNQIWEYMSLFVVWQKYKHWGYKPYIEESMFDNLKVLFPKLSILPSVGDLCDVPRSKVILKNEPLSTYDSWFKVDNNKKCDNIYLDQYSSRYDEILAYGVDKIRKEMSLSPQLVADCQNILLFHKQKLQMKSKDVIFIGMHYRGTDYGHHLKINYGIKKLSTSKYYLKAMEYFKDTYKGNHIIFILVTVDDKWLEENVAEIMNSTYTVIVNPTDGDRLHDLVLLAQCNHTIINYGTFGVTAALLADGTTFVYDLKLPLDHRGSTIGMGISEILNDTWQKIS